MIRLTVPAGQGALFADRGLRPVPPVPALRGKDSQMALDELIRVADHQGVPRARVVTVFCDLGDADEWPGTRDLAAEHAAHYGLRHEVVCRQVSDGRGGTRQQGLLEHILARGLWPDAARRYCTSDLKRAPVYRLLTRLAGEARSGGSTGTVPMLNVMGLRAEESPRRALKAPFCRDLRASNGRRCVDEWLPVHGWTRRQVWQRVSATGVRYHPVYHLMPRLSCRFCVLASESALVMAARLDPQGARLRARVEDLMALHKVTCTQAIAAAAGSTVWAGRQATVLLPRLWRAGHLFRQGLSMHDVIAKAEALGPVGTTVGEWRATVPADQWIENVEDAQLAEDWAA